MKLSQRIFGQYGLGAIVMIIVLGIIIYAAIWEKLQPPSSNFSDDDMIEIIMKAYDLGVNNGPFNTRYADSCKIDKGIRQIMK